MKKNCAQVVVRVPWFAPKNVLPIQMIILVTLLL